MNSRTILVFALVAAFAVVAFAVDVNGKWFAQIPGRDGQTRETTFVFKVDGETLTGTMSGRQGQELPISDGKISGDTLSFTVTMQMGDTPRKMSYTGKIAGEEIQFKREGGPGPAREFTAKRAK